MVLRPVRRLTSNIIAFGESPQDASRVIAPSGQPRRDRPRRDGARRDAAVARRTSSRRGSAWPSSAWRSPRINHDLRNMLSAAQLISDRLATIPDPLAQRLAPRLVATLDRAIAVLPVDADLWRGARAAPVAPAFRSERSWCARSSRPRAEHEARRSTTTSTFRRGSDVYADPGPYPARVREPEPQRRPGADGQGRPRTGARRRSVSPPFAPRGWR